MSLTHALSLLGGLQTPRLATYALVAALTGALGAAGGWTAQGWRLGRELASLEAAHKAAMSDQALAEADARSLQAKESLRAIERAQEDSQHIGALYAQLQIDNSKIQALAANRELRGAAVQRLLDRERAACTRASHKSVQPAPARPSAAAKPTEWQLDLWLPGVGQSADPSHR